MARHDRLSVWGAMLETGLVPLFYHGDPGVARAVTAACVEGGARAIEFTNRGGKALSVFAALVEWRDRERSDVALGVGSVVDAPTAALFIAHSADFVVGPVLNAEVARLCNRRKVAYVPGCGSVTEISEAEELGCEIVKVFPAGELGGPDFIKSVLAPMPWARLLPTGGVEPTEESIRAWLNAGAACLGMGSKLVRKDLVDAGDYAGLAALTAQVLGWVRDSRRPG
jgi:2-dehydro-3-deoxyphosphogluconate aldolase/(4S)-4-hydroxy-2-oxoglutarate aldolase